jgi:hypothetical protein
MDNLILTLTRRDRREAIRVLRMAAEEMAWRGEQGDWSGCCGLIEAATIATPYTEWYIGELFHDLYWEDSRRDRRRFPTGVFWWKPGLVEPRIFALLFAIEYLKD